MRLLREALFFNPGQAHRLVTHEDRKFFHMHKLIGLLVLGHFVWRLGLFFASGSMRLDATVWLPAWVVVHALLHMSSFEFHLPARRNKVYNIIWPEMRWHTMFFAYRSLVVLLLQWLSVNGQSWSPYLRGPVVLLTIFCADATTAFYEKQGENHTTMRGMPYPSYVSQSVIKVHNVFYSVSQIFASMNMMVRGPESVFLALIPIQIAPLLMTLVKKGILNSAGWHFYYTFSLALNYVHAIVAKRDETHVIDTSSYLLLTCMISILRFRFRVNKYMLWMAMTAYQWKALSIASAY
jgi:hypothetical protein